MKDLYDYLPNGYLETIHAGISTVRHFSGEMTEGTGTKESRIGQLKEALNDADAVVIGGGAGLSTSAGFTYSGERFQRYFSDFEQKYGFHDMYSGGFYVMELEPEVTWAFWARNIWINRYVDPPKPVYPMLLQAVKDKDYFVITTNVDHQFQRAGFSKSRLFYTQGDYGLFQSVSPGSGKTYDNEEWVRKALEAQGFVRTEDGSYDFPANGKVSMRIPTELVPTCPEDGSPVILNLRSDDSFVEDEGWHRASAAYYEYLRRHDGQKVLFLELGVGANTPVIIKYPFWQMTYENKDAVYACINYGEAYCPVEIRKQSICIDSDIGDVLNLLTK